MKKTILFLLIISLLSFDAYSAPRQIILIRHADKLEQHLTGPTLSSKGYIRALKFGFYFLTNFGEPNFVIVAKPKNKNSSLRELQTVAPLVNMLAERHPDTGFDILHKYTHDEFESLTKDLFKNKKFDDGLILICWRHSKIAELAKALGVNDKINPWPKNDYDSVYILDYNKSRKLIRFTILHNQFPVQDSLTWEDVHSQLR